MERCTSFGQSFSIIVGLRLEEIASSPVLVSNENKSVKESLCDSAGRRAPGDLRLEHQAIMSEKTTMQLGMIGLGRMGANMVRRLIKDGHQCVVFDRSADAVKDLVKENAVGATSLADFVKKLNQPRAVWLMVPAAVVDKAIADLSPLLEAGDILIDGGNSYYVDDIRRAKELASKGIHYVDVGT